MRPDLPRRLAAALDEGLEPDPARRCIAARELDDAIASSFNLEDGRLALAFEVARIWPEASLDASEPTTLEVAPVRWTPTQ